MRCSCGAWAQDQDRFCEACGAELGPAVGGPAPAVGGPAPAGGGPAGDGRRLRRDQPDLLGPVRVCAECGGAVAADGYCEQCGARPAPPRDHWVEAPSPEVGACCDRGLRHPRNEDAVAVAALAPQEGDGAGPLAALVVCDGVSSAPGSDAAALAASLAAIEVLAAGEPPPGAGAGPEQAKQTLARAAAAAQDAAAAVPDAPSSGGTVSLNPPSCTFVAALASAELLAVAWVGDSRAYWLPDTGPAQLLSQDDSWVSEAVALGVDRGLAEASPQAHAITRWLGRDAPHPQPRATTLGLDRAGWVLLCSDGLWNYCPQPQALAELVAASTPGPGPGPAVELARDLTRWAVQQGGQDNISVALARVAGPAG